MDITTRQEMTVEWIAGWCIGLLSGVVLSVVLLACCDFVITKYAYEFALSAGTDECDHVFREIPAVVPTGKCTCVPDRVGCTCYKVQ